MAIKRPEKEAALLQAIRERAIRTPESTETTSGSGDDNDEWLLDIRGLLLNSSDLDLVTDVFWDRMETRLPFQIGGLELGAVPLVSALIVKGNQRGYDVDGFVVRKSRKKSGLCRQIEGDLNHHPVVVVDDLADSGSSLRRVKAAVEDEGGALRDFFVIVDFESPVFSEYVADTNINLISLFNLADLGLKPGSNRNTYYPNRETLEVEWRFSPPDPKHVFVVPKSAPVLGDGLVFFGADNGFFYAVDKDTGDKKWEFQTGKSAKGILSSPVVHGPGVIFGAYDGTVYNLDRSTGEILWRYDAADAVGSSPVLGEDLGLLFIGLEQNVFNNKGALAALDLETGERIWEFVVREYLHATPCYCADRQLVAVGSNDKKVLCFDARNGEFKWEFEMKGELKAGITYDRDRNRLIAPSFDRNCYAIDIDTGAGTILFTGNHVFYNTALLTEGRLFVGSCGKILYIYDLNRNRMVKELKTLGRIMSHPRRIGQKVIFGSNDGCIREIDLDGNLLGGIYLPERPLTPIVHDDDTGRHYVVTAGNHLVCMRRS